MGSVIQQSGEGKPQMKCRLLLLLFVGFATVATMNTAPLKLAPAAVRCRAQSLVARLAVGAVLQLARERSRELIGICIDIIGGTGTAGTAPGAGDPTGYHIDVVADQNQGLGLSSLGHPERFVPLGGEPGRVRSGLSTA